MTSKAFMLIVAVFATTFLASAADEYYWGKVDGNANGNFDDPDHWHLGSASGATGTVPSNGARAKLQVDASYDVSFPTGEYMNFSRFMAYTYQGRTVTFDGSDCMFLHPENSEGTYETETFNLYRHNTVQDIVSFSVSGATPNNTTSANLAFSNFKFKVDHPTSRQFNATFIKGHYNFLNPCGKVWNGSTVAPCLYFFKLNNNNASTTADILDSMDVSFARGTTLLAPVVALQGNAYTNVLTMHGGEHRFACLYMPARINGQQIAERETVTDFVLDDGASLELTNKLGICESIQQAQRIERITVKNGSYMRFPGVSMNYGTAEITVDNGSATFGCDGKGTQNLQGASVTRVNLVSTNNSSIVFDHKGAAVSANGMAFHFGVSAATDASTACKHYFVADDSDITIRNGSSVKFYGASVAFRNGSTVVNSGTLTFVGNSGGMPLDVLIDGSAITNLSSLGVGTEGPVAFVVTNCGEIVSSGDLSFGTASAGATPYSVSVKIADASVAARSICGIQGGSSSAALVANGGVVRAISTSSNLIYGFASAELGEKGLAIDSSGYDVAVSQSFTDKVGESGQLILSGDGTKTMSGDLSGVTRVVVEKGSAAFTAAASLNDLVVSNGVSLVLDPEAPISARSVSIGGRLAVVLASGVEIGTTCDLIALAERPGAASISAWEDAYVAAGLPGGATAVFDCVEADGDGYILRLTVRASETITIAVSAGTSNVTDNVQFAVADTLVADVSSGASLAISGDLRRGALEKRGEGPLHLYGTGNLFIPGVFLYGGLLSVSDFDALGIGGNGNMSAGMLFDGVVEVLGPVSGASQDNEFTVSAANDATAVVFKNEVDWEMPIPTVTKGSIIKRGTGRLTWSVSGENTFGSSGYGNGSSEGGYWPQVITSIAPLVFDDVNGGQPTSGVFTPLTVAEGEIMIAGEGTGAKVTIPGSVTVGMPTAQGAAEPGLVLDNVELKYSASACHFNLGPGIGYCNNGDFARNPHLVLTNNATLSGTTMQVSRFGKTAVTNSVVVDGSTIVATYAIYPNRSQDEGPVCEYGFRNGSKLLVDRVNLFRDFTMRFDASVFAKNAALDPSMINNEIDNKICTGAFEFRNESLFCCGRIDSQSAGRNMPVRLLFDNSEWRPVTSGDFVFDWTDESYVKVTVEGDGLVLNVPDGDTWTMNTKLNGTGGLVKKGAGTLALGASAVAYGGVTRIDEGAIDLGGNVLSLSVSGAGVIRNGTIAGGCILLELDDAGESLSVPTVASDAGLSGQVRVSIGRTEERPLSEPFTVFDVLKYEGLAPDLSTFSLRDTGIPNIRGRFSLDVSRRVVVCAPFRSGFAIIVK